MFVLEFMLLLYLPVLDFICLYVLPGPWRGRTSSARGSRALQSTRDVAPGDEVAIDDDVGNDSAKTKKACRY